MKNTCLLLLVLLFGTCAEEVPFRERPYAMVDTLPVVYSFPNNGRSTATFTGMITYKGEQVTDHGFVWARDLVFESYPDRTVSSSLSKSVSLGVPNLSLGNTFTHTVEYVLPVNQIFDWDVWAYVKSNGYTYYGKVQFLECCTR